jgi:predicted ATPase
MLIQRIALTNLLSFSSLELELRPLNVLIGHNGSGKSNLIEAIALIQSTPKGIAGPIRGGGRILDWIWKGASSSSEATIETIIRPRRVKDKINLRYKLSFAAAGSRFEIVDERVENEKPLPGHDEPRYYFFYQNGYPVINVGNPDDTNNRRRLKREDIDPEKSILAQRRDPDNYPELTWLGDIFGKIRIYRDWSFGRYTPPRLPQRTDLATDFLDENCSNLGLILNNLHNQPEVKARMLDALNALYPSITDFGVSIEGGTAQIFLHEGRFSIPATRLSDGTLRYLCLLAILCHPTPPPLICIEEPELGLHPDALAKLAELMRDASQRTQLIVTTHSDILVDEFTDAPETVVTFEKSGESTVATRLDPKEIEEWLDKYTLGEMRQSGHIGGNRW